MTAQVAALPAPRLDGLHRSELTCTGGKSVTRADFETLLYVAVIVTDWLAVMLPAVAVKVVAAAPAATVTEAVTGNRALLLQSATVAPPVGAALESVTVQVAAAPEFRLPGAQLIAESTAGPARLTLALCDWPLAVAVMVAVWSVGIVPAVAANVVVVAPAATVTELATGSSVLLLASATVAPPVGAALESVTVQVVMAPEPSDVGLHTNCDTTAAALRLMPAVRDCPFNEAVIVAAWSLPMVPAVAVKVAVVAPALTTTEAATGSSTLLLERATATPPVGAAAESVTVQLDMPPELNVVGVQASDDTVGAWTDPPVVNSTSTQ